MTPLTPRATVTTGPRCKNVNLLRRWPKRFTFYGPPPYNVPPALQRGSFGTFWQGQQGPASTIRTLTREV